MYQVPEGLPNNRMVRVPGRAYAAPGETPPLGWLDHDWLVPFASGLALAGAVWILSALA